MKHFFRPPDDYGPKGPFVVDSTRDPHGSCGLAPGYAWASWYNEDPEGENVSLHWKPPIDSKTEPECEMVIWTKKGGVRQRLAYEPQEWVPKKEGSREIIPPEIEPVFRNRKEKAVQAFMVIK